MAMEHGDREKKQGGQDFAGAKSGENAPGMEGRAPTQAVMPPMTADLSQVERSLSSAPLDTNAFKPGEMKVNLPPSEKGEEVSGEAPGKAPGGPGEEGKGEKGEGKGKEEVAAPGAGGGEGAEAAAEEKDKEAAAAGGPGVEGLEGAAPEEGKGGQVLDASPLRALESVFGANFGDVKLVVDDVKTAAAGAGALVEQAGEILVSSAEVIDGKINPSLLAHEATHLMHLRNAEGKGGGNPSGAEAPGGDMRPTAPGDLEKEARSAAAAVMGGNPFEVAGRARPGSAMLNPAGADPAAGAAPQKVKLPQTQQMDFFGNAVTVKLPQHKEYPAEQVSTINVSGASQKPDWLFMRDMKLQFEGATFKGGTGRFRIEYKDNNKYVNLNKGGGGPNSTVNVSVDSSGKITMGETIPAMRLRAQGLGEIEVSGIGIDKGGLKFDAKLTSKELTELASKIVGGELKSGSIDIKRAAGKVKVEGDSNFGVSKAGKQLLEGELKINTRGNAYEGEAKVKFAPALKVFNSVKLEGKYTVSKGIEASATIGKELGTPPGGKFSLTGQLKAEYKSQGGLSFGGGVGASLKVNDKLGFEGSVMIDPNLKLSGELKGEFKPNPNLEVTGEVKADWDLTNNKIEAEGTPAAKIFKHYTVSVPLKYKSDGAPQWSLTPTFKVSNVKIPGLDKPLQKKIEPRLPRISVPLFGPLVIEGGPTFRLEAGVGPARVDNAEISAQIDIDNGFDFKEANLKGKMVCPFYAEAAVGLMLGLGLNLVVADGGAGIEVAARAGLPKDESKNAVTINLDASLKDGEGLKIDPAKANYDFQANLEIVGDLNVYARYDTWFTREQIYRQNLASTKIAGYGPLGAKGGFSYNEADGFKIVNPQWHTPEFKAPGVDWVRSKFNAIRNWF